MSVLIISIVVIIVGFAVLLVGAFFGISYLTRRKEAADLDRYLKGENCKWERIPTTGGAAPIPKETSCTKTPRRNPAE